MPTPPTLISYTETTDWVSGAGGTLVKSTASVSWQTGDILVVGAADEGTTTMGTPTATGLTFTKQQDIPGSASLSGAFVATAVAGSTSSGAVSVTIGVSTTHYGFGVWVFRGSAGVGNSVKQSTATKTVALTPTGADGAIVWIVADFAAAALQTITPVPTDTRQRVADGTSYTLYVADLTDQASAGSTSYGISGTGSGPFSIVVIEIKAAAGASFLAKAGLNVNQAVKRASYW